ncbi:MAG TPA: ABC transporter transmembrane domain-containing protein [Parafilimonas sp.]|nr:ABC transporter transmembrane domain-containing protein [Parafilimonas sp.]
MTVLSDQQLKYNDCGISAVKSIFNYYNIDIDRNYITEQIALDDKGAWLYDIKQFFDQHGFEASFDFIDLNAVRNNIGKVAHMLPCILPVKHPQGLHYVVVYGIEKNKLLILDPANPGQFKWTCSELIQHAGTTQVMYNWIESGQVIEQMLQQELQQYDIDPATFCCAEKQVAVLNKLTYFSYLKENFGFASAEAEKNFLLDLLNNLRINMLPKEFQAMHIEEGKLKINTPVVLSIRKKEIKQLPATAATPQKEPGLYSRLFKEMGHYRKIWYIFICTALFGALISQLTIFSNQILIDNILPSFNTNIILLFALGFGLFKIFELLVSVYKSFISIQLSTIFDNHFLSSFISKLNNYPIRYIQSFSRGDLNERMKDTLMLKTFFLSFFTRVLVDSIISVISLLFLLMIDWQVALIILAIMIIFVLWFKIITPRIRENENRRFLQKSKLFSTVLENIDGLQVIKLLRLEQFFKMRAKPAVKGMIDVQKKVRYINLINSAIISLLIIVATILIIIFLSYKAVNHHSITTGQIISFIALSARIFSSLTNILEENLDLQENAIILKRYFDFNAPEQVLNDSNTKLQPNYIKTIRFSNVGFEYIPQKPILKNFDFTISNGEKIKLEGSNGAGKSTFCKILSMLYKPASGDVYINEERSVFYNQAALRKKVLLVSNDDVLFNDTLAFNITFDKEPETERIIELSKQIGFHEFITQKDEGFDFIITEQGRNISTGQRKKILLLRALLSEAEFIIIDEVLSGIDVESKEKIESYINTQSAKTFIIISHEPVDGIAFDRVIKLNNGQLAAA